MKHLYIAITLFLAFTNSGFSQVVINEVSYTNASLNNNEIGQPEDWIEIYNSGNSSVNLYNYSLMKNNSKEWHFPNITIGSHAYLKLLASGRDTTISGVFRHISFKISSGDYNLELKNNLGAVIDQFYIREELQTDHSYGRTTDGGSTFGFFNSPTFGTSNNSAVSFNGYESAPVFSNNGGFFQNSQMVTISGSSTGVIHYTLDGSIPNISSPVYSSPILINNTKVLAARIFSNTGLLPGPVIKKSFFINESDLEMPVFSVTIDSIHLWDDTEGMYVEGPAADTAYPHYGANYWKDIEKPCYIEYFDVSHSKKFETAAGLKIFGGYSRTFPQKSFKVKCRAHYGQQELSMPIIPEKKYIGSYRDIILRNGGTDNEGTHFRDAFMQRIMKKQFVDYMAYQPSMVYLNGKFWGFYEIRERQDEVYIEKNHGYEKDQIDFLEHAGMIYTIAGTDTGFYNMYNYITTADAASSGFYKRVNAMLDVENFCDYFIAETYYGNTDWIGNWVNNIKFWRPNLPGGRWRYILWDLDFGMGLYSTANTNYLNKARYPFVSNEHSEIFDALLGNTQFRNYFVNRYADLINTVYDDQNVQKLANSMKNEVNSLMALHFNKWGGSYTDWNNAISTMLAFNTIRRQAARNHIQAEFNLPNQVDVELDVMPAGAGKVKISTVVPDSLPWKGVYFNGVPVRITATANAGYKFSHWSSSTGNENGESFERNIEEDDKFIAHFEKTEFDFQVFPNPVNDKLTVDYELSSEMKVNINLYSVDGRFACKIVDGELQKEGPHRVPFSFRGNGLANGMYFIKIDAGEDSRTIKLTKQ